MEPLSCCCGDLSGGLRGSFGQKQHFLGSLGKLTAVREHTNSGCFCGRGRTNTRLVVGLGKIVGCKDCFPPALNHCRPGQKKGDETGITTKISVKARKAAREPSPRVPPWEVSLEHLSSLGQCRRSRGVGRRQQESTGTSRADTYHGVPQHIVSGVAPGLGMDLLGLSIRVSTRATSPWVPLQSWSAEPVVFGEPLVRQVHPSVSDPCWKQALLALAGQLL